MNDAEDAKKSVSDRKKANVEIEREFIDISRSEFERMYLKHVGTDRDDV